MRERDRLLRTLEELDIVPRMRPVRELQPEREAEIIGTDTRKQVSNTTVVPHRWICQFNTVFADPRKAGTDLPPFESGSGVLIGSRYLLTVAHNLFPMSGPLARSRAKSVTVMLGRKGKNKPFGQIKVSDFNIHPTFERSLDIRFDYALLRLEKAVGKQKFKNIGAELGWWGRDTSSLFEVLPDVTLTGATVTVCGYPKTPSKWEHTQVTGSDLMHEVPAVLSNGTALPTHISFLTDTTEGQSGSPAWIHVDRKTKEHLPAATKTSAYALVALQQMHCQDQGANSRWRNCVKNGKPTYNLGLRLTDDVKKQIDTWIADWEKTHH